MSRETVEIVRGLLDGFDGAERFMTEWLGAWREPAMSAAGLAP